MAGASSGDEENPVPVNVVALIDILMCLLLFYMCASKFPNLTGRMDAYLPKDKGANAGPPPPTTLDEVRIRMSWENEQTVRKFGNRPVENDPELTNLLVAEYGRLKGTKKRDEKDPPVILEVTAMVPWREVVHVMDLCKRNSIEQIEFAFTSDAAGQELGK